MWNYDSLYKKAKFFVRKGLEHEEPHSTEVPLWCILSLELLARATLSRVNTALLAELRDEMSILTACGFPSKKAPSSVTAKGAFHRCVVVCEDFSEEDYKRCIEWLNWRNEELHTGSLPFDELKTSEWLPDFFRICNILLEKNETNLENFLGIKNSGTAEKMIESLSHQKRAYAHAEVKEKKAKFDALSVEDRLERIKQGSAKAKTPGSLRARSKEITCPSCEGVALVVGNLIRSTTPRDHKGQLVQDDIWLPTVLGCYCCGLKLDGHAYVSALGFGDQFLTKDVLDPKDYYEIEFAPYDSYEPDYYNE